MAKKPQPYKRAASAQPLSSFNERLTNGSRAAVEAVRELVAPTFEKIDSTLLEHAGDISGLATRVASIETSGPTSPDELVSQLVRENKSKWDQFLK
jgi:hypothetical protein